MNPLRSTRQPELKPSRPSHSSFPALMVVLLLHLGLLALFSQQQPGWWHKPPAAADTPTPPAIAWLNLPPPRSMPDTRPEATPVQPIRPEDARSQSRRPEQPAAAPQAPIQFVPAAPDTAAPATVEQPTAAPQAPAAVASAAKAAPVSQGLRLTLPRSALPQPVNPALANQRNDTAQRTLESRMQAALGTVGGPITEERLADGSIIMRKGNQCVIARPARAGTLDPFNQAVSPLPRMIDRC